MVGSFTKKHLGSWFIRAFTYFNQMAALCAFQLTVHRHQAAVLCGVWTYDCVATVHLRDSDWPADVGQAPVALHHDAVHCFRCVPMTCDSDIVLYHSPPPARCTMLPVASVQ